MRGEVNPADLFTKHLSSEDRVSDLCELFRCRFASGRAAGAPSLKRHGLEEKLLALDMVHSTAGPTMEQEGFYYQVGDYEGEAVPEAYLHDASQLPHLIGGDLRLLFPRAVAAEELEELPEDPDWLEQRAEASREEVVKSLQADIRATQAPGHALTAEHSCQSVVRPRLENHCRVVAKAALAAAERSAAATGTARIMTKLARQRRRWRPLSRACHRDFCASSALSH